MIICLIYSTVKWKQKKTQREKKTKSEKITLTKKHL